MNKLTKKDIERMCQGKSLFGRTGVKSYTKALNLLIPQAISELIEVVPEINWNRVGEMIVVAFYRRGKFKSTIVP
jgi:hypothetical protein